MPLHATFSFPHQQYVNYFLAVSARFRKSRRTQLLALTRWKYFIYFIYFDHKNNDTYLFVSHQKADIILWLAVVWIEHCFTICLSQSLIVLLLANIRQFTDWLIVYCIRQLPKQETGDSSTTPATSDQNHSPQSAIVYAQILQNSETEPGIDDYYANVTFKNDCEDSRTVLYSELQKAGE